MKNQSRARVLAGVLMLSLVAIAFGLWSGNTEPKYTRAVAQMTRSQVQLQTAKLEIFLLPPDGTPLREVEAVYGNTSVNNPDEIIKGRREVLHWLDVLPTSNNRADFRAQLAMRVKNGRVFESNINHLCVGKNRKQMGLGIHPPTAQEKAVQLQLEAEERGVLVDLLLIQNRYRRRLNAASWNRAF